MKYVLSISDSKYTDVIICYFIKHIFQEWKETGTSLQGSKMQSCRNCICFIFPPRGRKSLQKWLPSYLPSASCFDDPLESWLPTTHSLSRRKNMLWDMILQFHMVSLIVIIHLMCQYQAKQPATWMCWSYLDYCEDQIKSFERNNEEQMHSMKLFLIFLQK